MAGRSGASAGAVRQDRDLAADPQAIFRKLKPGPCLPPDQVIVDQRRRLHGAMITLVDRVGWNGVKVRLLSETAGISTGTFYKHFIDADECLASTYDAVMATALRRSLAAQQLQTDWRESLCASVATLMDDLSREPRAGRLALLHVFTGGPGTRKRIAYSVGGLEELLAASFTLAPKTVRPPRHLIAGMTAGMLRVARKTTLAGRADELPGLAQELTDWMLALPSPEVHSLSESATRGYAGPEHPERDGPFGEGVSMGSPAIGDDRERLLRAAIRVAAQEGFSALTAPRLRAEVGVSRRRFASHFDDAEDCFLDGVGLIAEEAAVRAQAWCRDDDGWERQICRLVLGLCAQAAADRVHSRLTFLGIFATGRQGLLWRERMVERTGAELRATVPAEARLSLIAAEASVAAAWHIAQADIAAGRIGTLPAVAPLLSYVVLAPIVGARTASAVIQSELRGTAAKGALNA
jgi:AcrR family transcriptional regulator